MGHYRMGFIFDRTLTQIKNTCNRAGNMINETGAGFGAMMGAPGTCLELTPKADV